VCLPGGSLEGVGRGAGATRREDSGERRGALVRFGSARRERATWRGFSTGWEAADISPTALGVGVAGKGIGVTGILWVRRFLGVTGVGVGAMVVLSAFTLSVTSAAFRLRERLAAGDGGGGGMDVAMPLFPSTNPPIRADLRVAILIALD
jgi:hypothetical protein